MRIIDDFIFVTPRQDQAELFLHTMNEGECGEVVEKRVPLSLAPSTQVRMIMAVMFRWRSPCATLLPSTSCQSP